jgi:hypothetical protein
MGEYKLVFTVFTVLVLVIAVVGMTIFLVMTVLDVRAEAQTTDVKLDAIGIAHGVESCLKEKSKSEYVTESFLDSIEARDKNINELCDIKMIATAGLTDLETDKSWEFKYGFWRSGWEWLKDKVKFWESKAEHSIFVNIQCNDGSVHVGRLDVEA